MRNLRPFCCRIFPFRPVIDSTSGIVVDLQKTQNKHFSPCWIVEPLGAWKKRAIDAWNFVLSDRNNLQFYARFYLCIKKSETSSATYQQALIEDDQFRNTIFSLDSMEEGPLRQLCAKFFSYS